MNIRKLIDRLRDEIVNCRNGEDNSEKVSGALSTVDEIEECVNEIESCANNIDSEKDNLKKIVY